MNRESVSRLQMNQPQTFSIEEAVCTQRGLNYSEIGLEGLGLHYMSLPIENQ
jgi:hypothetical protein